MRYLFLNKELDWRLFLCWFLLILVVVAVTLRRAKDNAELFKWAQNVASLTGFLVIFGCRSLVLTIMGIPLTIFWVRKRLRMDLYK